MANVVWHRGQGTKPLYVVGVGKAIEGIRTLRGFEQHCYAAFLNVHCKISFDRLLHFLLRL
jgi:hypothetical protein